MKQEKAMHSKQTLMIKIRSSETSWPIHKLNRAQYVVQLQFQNANASLFKNNSPISQFIRLQSMIFHKTVTAM